MILTGKKESGIIVSLGIAAWIIAILAFRSARVQDVTPAEGVYLILLSVAASITGTVCFWIATIAFFRRPERDERDDKPDDDDSGPDGSNDDEDFDPSPRPLRGEAREFLVRTFGKQMTEEEPWK